MKHHLNSTANVLENAACNAECDTARVVTHIEKCVDDKNTDVKSMTLRCIAEAVCELKRRSVLGDLHNNQLV